MNEPAERPYSKYRHMTLDEIKRELERTRQAGMPNELAEALLERCLFAAIQLEVGEGS